MKLHHTQAYLCNNCQLLAQMMQTKMTYVITINLYGSRHRFYDPKQCQWYWWLACSSPTNNTNLDMAITAENEHNANGNTNCLWPWTCEFTLTSMTEISPSPNCQQ